MRRIGLVCVVALAWLCGDRLLAAARAGGVEDLPPAVRAAVAVLAGANAIESVEQERTHGVVIHEVAWTADGQEHEAELTAAGDIVELEDDVPAAEVPAAVRATTAQLLGSEPRTYQRRLIVVFEASVSVNGKEKEALVLPTGCVLADDDVFEGRSLSSQQGDVDEDGAEDDGDDDDGPGLDDDDDGDDDDDEDDGPDENDDP